MEVFHAGGYWALFIRPSILAIPEQMKWNCMKVEKNSEIVRNLVRSTFFSRSSGTTGIRRCFFYLGWNFFRFGNGNRSHQMERTFSLVSTMHFALINWYSVTLRPCSHLVPEHDYRWALMWTHRFFKDPPKNSDTVSVPEYKVETLYSGTKVGVYILGTQCLNTAPVWTWPKTQNVRFL